MSAVAANPGDYRFVAFAYAVAGASYPAWTLLAPGPRDPFAVWVMIGVLMVAASIAVWNWQLSRDEVANLALLLGSLVTLHFFLLASVNDMSSFYAIGSSMAMLATLMNTRSVTAIAAYAAFVAVIAIGLYLAAPNALKLAYWAGPTPAFLFAYRRLAAQNALERRLEHEVVQRTQELSVANQRLREEMRARERLTEALSVQRKFEAVARMAGGVAHDFNNLLTTIGVYAELLCNALPADSSLRREVEEIQRAQRELASLTYQLLTLGRNSQVRLTELELDQVISDMSDLLRRVLHPHELVLLMASQRQRIRGNIDQLRRVTLNLALNARDAMITPGRVTIEIQRSGSRELSQRLGVALEHEAYVGLAVTDSGEGMSEATRARAFDPFFTTKSPEHGSGLGLATVQAVVNQAGGHVRLLSELGHGTRCELYWPLAAEAEPVDARAILPRLEAEPAPRARILVVEDEEPIRSALVRVLASEGHFAAEAGDAEHALAMLGEPGSRFDVLITDVVMPRSSGLDLAEQVIERWPAMKVVLISGYLRDYSLGDIDTRFAFLAKPFSPRDLQDKVREALGYSFRVGEAGSSAAGADGSP